MDHISLHVRIKVDHCHILAEIRHDLHITVSAPRIVNFLNRLHLTPFDSSHWYVTDGSES